MLIKLSIFTDGSQKYLQNIFINKDLVFSDVIVRVPLHYFLRHDRALDVLVLRYLDYRDVYLLFLPEQLFGESGNFTVCFEAHNVTFQL